MGAVFEDTVHFNDVECILVSSGSVRYLLDPAKNFAIVRVEEWILESSVGSPFPKPAMISDIVMSDFLDCGNGIWLPQMTISSGYNDGKLESQMIFAVSLMEINKSIHNDVFTKSIPYDAFVVDDIRGITSVQS
jgi:hypothetical protein